MSLFKIFFELFVAFFCFYDVAGIGPRAFRDVTKDGCLCQSKAIAILGFTGVVEQGIERFDLLVNVLRNILRNAPY